jgi:hypothetical protein
VAPGQVGEVLAGPQLVAAERPGRRAGHHQQEPQAPGRRQPGRQRDGLVDGPETGSIDSGYPMRILWVGTKLPWPPRDGGRLVASLTVEALAAAGHEITVAAPGPIPPPPGPPGVDLVAVRPRGWPAAAWIRAALGGRPLTIARHDRRALRVAVDRLLAGRRFDVVHAEQLQAMAAAAAALRHGVPLVLRAQNVESALWAALGRPATMRGRLARREARRLAVHEGREVARAAGAVALTVEDAASLAALSGREVASVPAPFPATLPGGPPGLPGRPAVVVLAGGWLPNREAAAWWAREAWPAVRGLLPEARLHLFGAPPAARWARGPGIARHPAPPESERVFRQGAVLAVPLRVASGVRMKVLEAWARGLPVVASPEAGAGLGAGADRAFLSAGRPSDFAQAIAALHRDPALGRGLTDAGRAILRARHDPAGVAASLTDLYLHAAARGSVRPTS